MYLRNLSPFEISDYTSWKTAKKLKQLQQTSLSITKQDGYGARTDQEKANTFAEHLVKVFTSNIRKMGPGDEEIVFDRQESTQYQMTETTRLTKSEVRSKNHYF